MQIWPEPKLRARVRDLLDEREAVTIAALIRLGPLIADSYVVAATQRAAELFGYQEPAELEGRFISQIHNLDDIRTTRRLSTMRALGVRESTESYTMRIVRKDSSQIPVRKHVNQQTLEDKTIWITYHEPSPYNIGPPIPDVPISEDAVRAYCGYYCLAEVEGILMHHLNLMPRWEIPFIKHIEISKKENHISSVMNTRQMLQYFPEYILSSDFDDIIIGFGPGESWPLPDGTWVHHCRHCNYIWHSKNPRPYKCNSHAKGPDGKILCQRTTWWQGSDMDSIRDVRKRRREEAAKHSG
ncbi:hypothetical protein [Candidatus Entotheonella palauensis]|uniref:hypothetical protein n=1 Tax=Candidatus Entotheonella palauensis TaxID=93172 RepID=UPI0004B9B119|nr:hypothetical protein [Candidatus Entotheonella palauensis]